VALVATRWRRLELASWRLLLQRAVAAHAAGAHRAWFHIYRLLGAAAAGTGGGAEGGAGVLGTGGGAALEEGLPPSEASYRRAAAALEAFLQTATVRGGGGS
jgi:midasin